MVGSNKTNNKDADKMSDQPSAKKDKAPEVLEGEAIITEEPSKDSQSPNKQQNFDQNRGGYSGRGRGGFQRGRDQGWRGQRGGRYNHGGNRGGFNPKNNDFSRPPFEQSNMSFQQKQNANKPQQKIKQENTPPEYDQSIWTQNPFDTGVVESQESNDVNESEEIPMPVKKEVKKFTQRCRLFVGNITPDTTEDDLRKMFEPYGETEEVFLNAGKGFGFIRLDYRANAETAKSALDGLPRKGRILRIRFASQATALKVKNLSPVVSNEMLEDAFGQLGELEKAVVIVDDRGRPTGEGIVEFARKQNAMTAFRRITEGVFILTTSPRPVNVEWLSQNDEEDGYHEQFLPRNEMLRKEREVPPRFAPPNSFEFNFCQRWKRLFELEKQKEEEMRLFLEEEKMKIESEMENALMEQHEEMLKQDLMRQQEELRRLQEMRQQSEARRRAELEIKVQGMRSAYGANKPDDRGRLFDNRDDRDRYRDSRPKDAYMPITKSEPLPVQDMGMPGPPLMSMGTSISQPLQPPPPLPASLQMEMERGHAPHVPGMEPGKEIPSLVSDAPPPPPSLMTPQMGFDANSPPGYSAAGRRRDDKSIFQGREKARPLMNDRRREGPPTGQDGDLKRSRRF